MIQKTQIKRTGRMRVTFSYPAAEALTVHIAGQFNDWQPVEMRRGRDGEWEAVVELAPDREYEFRYIVNGTEWVNDPAADRFVPNPFGSDNSVACT